MRESGQLANGRLQRWRIAGTVAVVGLAVVTLGTGHLLGRGAEPETFRLGIGLPQDHSLAGIGRSVALAPDGRTAAIVATRQDGTRRLFLRAIDEVDPRPVAGSEGALRPFFSPDGRWVGFSTHGDLKKVGVAGGGPFVIAPVEGSPDATWLDDGRIVYEQPDGLWLVSAAGGESVRVAVPRQDRGEQELERPAALPGADHVLVELGTTEGRDGIALVALETGRITVLVREGSSPRYLHPGHLVYSRHGTLFVVGFDPRRLRVSGTPRPVLQGVHTAGRGAAQFDVARDGRLLYVPGSGNPATDALAWVAGDGSVARLAGSERQGEIMSPRLGPDSRRIALALRVGATNDIWLFDQLARVWQRVTRSGTADNPAWSPDGEWVYYTENRAGDMDIYRRRATLDAPAERVLGGPGDQVVTDVTPDAGRLLYVDDRAGEGSEIWELDPGAGAPRRVRLEAFDVDMPVSAPDGRRIAYRSLAPGRRGVWVASRGDGSPARVSGDGGSQPVWAADGRLFLRSGNGALVEVSRDEGGAWPSRIRIAAGVPASRWAASFDVAADGSVLIPWRSVRSGLERISASGMILAQGWLEHGQ